MIRAGFHDEAAKKGGSRADDYPKSGDGYYVQSLPGAVLGTDDFRNDLIVRGGSPLENLDIVDNIEIPNINTFANFASAGGTVSILDAQLIQDVTFLTGGFPASYTNRTSSVLQVSQREGNRDISSCLRQREGQPARGATRSAMP